MGWVDLAMLQNGVNMQVKQLSNLWYLWCIREIIRITLMVVIDIWSTVCSWEVQKGAGGLGFVYSKGRLADLCTPRLLSYRQKRRYLLGDGTASPLEATGNLLHRVKQGKNCW